MFPGWLGLYAPAGLPAPVACRMIASLQAAVTQHQVHRRVIQMGNFDFVDGAETIATRTRRDADRWAKAAREGLLTPAGG